MSDFAIILNAGGAIAALDKVDAIGDKPGDATLAFGRAIEQNIRQTFRDQADPWGNAWPQLSPVTIQQRQRRGNASIQPLIDTGAMYGTLATKPDGDDAVVSMGGPDMWPNEQQFGNPNNKAWGRGSAPIPARPFFPMDASGVNLPDTWAQAALAPVEQIIEEAIA